MFISYNHELNLCNIFQGPNEIKCNKQETIMNISGLNLIQTRVETLTYPFNWSLSEFFLFSFNKTGDYSSINLFGLCVFIVTWLLPNQNKGHPSIILSPRLLPQLQAMGFAWPHIQSSLLGGLGQPETCSTELSLVLVIRLQAPKLPESGSRIWYTSYCSHQHGSLGLDKKPSCRWRTNSLMWGLFGSVWVRTFPSRTSSV